MWIASCFLYDTPVVVSTSGAVTLRRAMSQKCARCVHGHCLCNKLCCCHWWLLCHRALPDTIRVLGWTDLPKPDFSARWAPEIIQMKHRDHTWQVVLESAIANTYCKPRLCREGQCLPFVRLYSLSSREYMCRFYQCSGLRSWAMCIIETSMCPRAVLCCHLTQVQLQRPGVQVLLCAGPPPECACHAGGSHPSGGVA